MEAEHDMHQNGTRDLNTIDLDMSSTRESPVQGTQLEEAVLARTRTIRTRGLFHFMELPTEIRLTVC
jgi:hypothetical protein